MRRQLIMTTALALLIGSGAVAAQDGQPAGGQDPGQQGQAQGQERRQRGGQGDERRFDPEEMRQRIIERVQEQMGASDEEWQVMSPKLERVMKAAADARAGGMGMMMGRRGGGPGGPGNDEANPSEVAKASRELRETLQDEAAPAEQIQERLTAFRAARQKAETELQAARTDLQAVLTQRQEATLVMMGMLE